MASTIVEPARRQSHSIVAHIIDRIVFVCGVVFPYALVGLIVRLVVARSFFLDGQAKVDGPIFAFSIPGLDPFPGFDFSLILPTQVREAALQAFATQFASVPIPSTLIAYCLTFAEFLLPIFLVIGFATRISALLLLIVTIVLQVYVAPEALWTTHVYWIATLLVLMTCGAGQISVDQLIRHLYRR